MKTRTDEGPAVRLGQGDYERTWPRRHACPEPGSMSNPVERTTMPKRKSVQRFATIRVEIVSEYDNGTVRCLAITPVEHQSRLGGPPLEIRPSILVSGKDVVLGGDTQ